METIGRHLEELRLYPLKWFDYRALSPEGCDLLFVSEWLQVHARYEEREKFCVDLDREGREVLPQPWRNVLAMRYDPAFRGLMHRLRLLCDRKGYRYDRWWSFAYQVLMDNSVRNLAGVFLEFSTSSFKSSVVELCNEHLDQFIEFSLYISRANYTGAAWQREYFGYIRKEVEKRYPNKWREFLDKLERCGSYVEVSGGRNDG